MEFLVKNHHLSMNFSDFRRRCKLYQDGNDESVKTFRELSINVSTNVVNETENRLLKSGKDNKSQQITQTPEA
jgi:hypothetical protein